MRKSKESYNRGKIDELLNKVGLNGYRKRKINELSVGEKQRVSIARALIKNLSALLADEPTGNFIVKILEISSSFTNRGGIGISMNIFRTIQSSLENSMTVYFLTGSNLFDLYGTYQHVAQSTALK